MDKDHLMKQLRATRSHGEWLMGAVNDADLGAAADPAQRKKLLNGAMASLTQTAHKLNDAGKLKFSDTELFSDTLNHLLAAAIKAQASKPVSQNALRYKMEEQLVDASRLDCDMEMKNRHKLIEA